MGRLILPANHRRFDGTFKCAAEHLAPHSLTWLHLKAQGIQESLLDPKAVSHTGPRGIMQFTKSTGKEWGLITEEDFFDPAKSINAGARYMAKILDWYRNGAVILPGRHLSPVRDAVETEEWEMDEQERWQLALATYNFGAGKMLKAVEAARARRLDPTDWGCVANCITVLLTNPEKIREVLLYVAYIKKYYALLKTEHTPPAAVSAAVA